MNILLLFVVRLCVKCFLLFIHSSSNYTPISSHSLPTTLLGFITFDAHIHFYNLNAKLTSPHMLVVSDVTDVILPLPEDILVNLAESRAVVEALLDALPTMFKQQHASPTSCTGKCVCF